MEYHPALLKDELIIKKLYTVHYFEFSSEYKFVGEKHDFWEFVYVDKGEVIITADEESFVLKQGNIVFHKPNEWHNIKANGKVAPNIAIVTFECLCDAMKFFENRIAVVGQKQKDLISKIIEEYINAFSTPLNNPYTNKLKKNENAPFGSAQLLKYYLCELLISFLRNDTQKKQQPMQSLNYANAMFKILVNYMEQNINKNITLEELAHVGGMSKKTIENIFASNVGRSAIDYFIYLKIEYAKKYLRENNYNVTQIADMLGYANVHYFSRQFKKTTGMSPTEYAISIKTMLLR